KVLTGILKDCYILAEVLAGVESACSHGASPKRHETAFLDLPKILSYTPSRFGAEYFHAIWLFTRSRPDSPIDCRSRGLAMRADNFLAKSCASLGFAYSAAPSALRRVSKRSNATIGLPRAMYSRIFTNVDRLL